jgi:hypothetical protein
VIAINGGVPKSHVRVPMEQSHVVVPLQSINQPSPSQHYLLLRYPCATVKAMGRLLP